MATEIEEVITGANLFEIQQVGPDAAQHGFNRTEWFDVIACAG
jgi:hypothetical protein